MYCLYIYFETCFNLDFQPLYVYINGEPIKELEHLSSASLSQSSSGQQKRPLTFTSTSDDEDSKKSQPYINLIFFSQIINNLTNQYKIFHFLLILN